MLVMGGLKSAGGVGMLVGQTISTGVHLIDCGAAETAIALTGTGIRGIAFAQTTTGNISVPAIYYNNGTTNLHLSSAGNIVSTSSGGTVVVEGDNTSPVKAAFRITPQDAAPTGAAVIGDMYVDTSGVLYICTTAGTPGTFTKVGTQT